MNGLKNSCPEGLEERLLEEMETIQNELEKGGDYLTAADTAGRLSAIDREIKQREQSRERRSIEERLAEYKKDTERQNQGTRRGKYHDWESSL